MRSPTLVTASTIAGLLPTSENDTSAALLGVSIRGRWASPPRRATAQDGTEVETADDLEIDGLDFTASPGVAGAHAVVVSAHEVPNVPPAPPNSGKSWEATVQHSIVEAAPDAEIIETAVETDPAYAGTVPFADRGDYLPDRVPRFPLDTRENAQRAWLVLRRDDTARQYTAAQLKRVRGRVTKALTEFGVYADASSGWLVASPTRVVSEGYMDDGPGFGGAYRISLTNGPTTVSVCCYQLDPHDLDAVGRAAMSGALAAIKAIDPDLDADIDVGATSGAESAPAAVERVPGPAEPEPPAPPVPAERATPDPSSDEDEPVADEPNTPTAGTAPADSAAAAAASEPDRIDRLTDMIGKLITAIVPAAPSTAEAAPAAPVAETAPAAPAAPAAAAPVAETEDQRIARLVQEQVTARVQDLVESGQLGAGRKGLTGTAPTGAPQASGGQDLNEHGLPAGWPAKPLHEYSDAEFTRYAMPQLENYVLNGRVPRT